MEKEKDKNIATETEEKKPGKLKKPSKKEVIGGYTRKQYEDALRELDPEEKDFFDRTDYTETQSTVSAVIKALIYIIAIVSVSVAIAVFAISCANDIFAFVKEEKTVEVVIPEYVTTEELSEILGEAGAINYPWLFRFYCSLKDVDTSPAYKFVAGTYTVATNMNYDTLMLSFVEKMTLTTVRITFPEGSTVDEIIALFEANGCSTREKFLECMETYDFAAEYEFLKDIDMTDRYYLLEGYLYPDTYDFYTGRSPEYYLCRLLDQFNKVFRQSGFFKMLDETDYTLDEIMIIASIIEKEAYQQNDFDIVSSVIHNRLKDPVTFPYLECDSTVVYALSCEAGERVTDITGEDLNLDNPYNSYNRPGLTPGPICNPSFNSIACAFEPAQTDVAYYYFVSDSYGVMYYATTLKEHEDNIAAIKEAEAQAEAERG
ncbi:MAG: endolytic transglycosylase MltG [Clostridia bacterium]|nr:endolytic transglycosylase MltG [Clostridia bacterium]